MRQITLLLFIFCIGYTNHTAMAAAAASSKNGSGAAEGIDSEDGGAPTRMVRILAEADVFAKKASRMLAKEKPESFEFDIPDVPGPQGKTPSVQLLYGEKKEPEIVIKAGSNQAIMVHCVARMLGFEGLTPNCSYFKAPPHVHGDDHETDDSIYYAEECMTVFRKVSPDTRGKAADLARKSQQKGTLTLSMIPYEMMERSDLFNRFSAEQAFIIAWITNQQDYHRANVALQLNADGIFDFALIDNDLAFGRQDRRVWSFMDTMDLLEPFSNAILAQVKTWDLKDFDSSLRPKFLEFMAHSKITEEHFDIVMYRLRLLQRVLNDFSGWSPSSFMIFFKALEDGYSGYQEWVEPKYSGTREGMEIDGFKVYKVDTLGKALALYAYNKADGGSPSLDDKEYFVLQTLGKEYLKHKGNIDLKAWVKGLVDSGDYHHFHDPSKPLTAEDIWDMMGITPVE